VLALALRLPLIAGGQIDYDEGVYWESLRSMAAGHQLFGEIYSSQPPGFLLLLYPFFGLLGQSLLAARLGVLLLFLAGMVGAYRTVSLLAGRGAGLLAMAVLAADPIGFRESVALQADAPAMALALLAVALGVQAGAGGRGGGLAAAGAGALLALAVLVKPLAGAAGAGLLMALWMAPVPGRERVRTLALMAGGGLLAATAILLPFQPVWAELWRQSVGLHFVARASELGGIDIHNSLPEVPLLAAGVAGLLVALRRAPRLALVVGSWAAASALMLAVQKPLWPHHLVALTVPLSLLAGGLAHLGTRFELGYLRGAAVVVIVALSFWGAWRIQLGQMSDSHFRLAAAGIQAATSPSAPVVTDDQYLAALAGRNTPPQLVDTSLVRVTSGDLSTEQVEAIAQRSGARAFVFATGRLTKLPGLEDWVRLNYPHRQQLDDSHVLYTR
jgi:4-amino-4-deoxy-L-arabinose transferase-like glycosyltransferase